MSNTDVIQKIIDESKRAEERNAVLESERKKQKKLKAKFNKDAKKWLIEISKATNSTFGPLIVKLFYPKWFCAQAVLKICYDYSEHEMNQKYYVRKVVIGHEKHFHIKKGDTQIAIKGKL